MDFERRQIKKQHSHRIILEFDVIGDIDLITCRQIADKLTNSIAKGNIEVTYTKALVQPTPQRTHDQVQLPCANSNGQGEVNTLARLKKCTKTT